MEHSTNSSEFLLALAYILSVTLCCALQVNIEPYKELWANAFFLVSGYGIIRQGQKYVEAKNLLKGGSNVKV
jgi:hypothetical protein